MNITLTQADLKVLKSVFPLDEHEFDYGKNCYIKEASITDRIEQVDPAFSFEIKQIIVRDSAGEGGKEVGTVTVHASMTIKGATRHNTGMAVIMKSDDKTVYVDKNQLMADTPLKRIKQKNQQQRMR